MIAYGMQALGLDKERIAYEWAWTHRGFDLTGDVFWEKGNRNTLYLVNDLNVRKFERTEKDKTAYGIDFADWVDYKFTQPLDAGLVGLKKFHIYQGLV